LKYIVGRYSTYLAVLHADDVWGIKSHFFLAKFYGAFEKKDAFSRRREGNRML